MFASFPADCFFSHPINLVLLNGFDVFMEKKKSNNDAHGEINELTQFPLVFFTSLISLMAIAHSLFSLSLFLLILDFNFFLTFWLVALHSHSCWSVGFLFFSCCVWFGLFFLEKPFCSYFAAEFLLPLSSPPHFLSCSPVTLINFWPVDSA